MSQKKTLLTQLGDDASAEDFMTGGPCLGILSVSYEARDMRLTPLGDILSVTFSEKCLERRLCGDSLGKCPKRGLFDSAGDVTHCWTLLRRSALAGEK